MNKLGSMILLVALLCCVSAARAEGDKAQKGKPGLAKTTTQDQYDFIAINNILLWLSNNGSMAHNHETDGSGLEWPKNSGKYAIFQDGLVWGGKVQGTTRIGGSTYSQGLQSGPIKSDGTAADPNDTRYRIYKVDKVNRSTYEGLDPEVQQRLQKDFLEWPVADGAPYTDANGDGQYTPDFNKFLDGEPTDTPWFIGDEVLWFVSNDLDESRTSNLYGTSPIGVEVQTMVWGYNQTGPLGNMVFTKYTVINKGADDLTDAYFAKWSDPDLGDAGDDLVGVDTTLSLGYVYNGRARDDVYGTPPTAGYDFFQGPVIPAPGEQAVYNFGTLPDWKNLELSSFAFYINSDPVYNDPDLGVPAGADQMYFYLQGRLGNGDPFIDPNTGLEVKVTLAGDPVTKTGWIDGVVNAPDDRRFLMTTGPFTLNNTTDLANGKISTQEVVVASIVAMGSDRISSLQVLKYYDRFAQLAYDNNFQLPQAPPPPPLGVSPEDGGITLTWGNSSATVTESWNDKGFAFQGYNLYQFPSPSATLADGKRLATYDIVDQVTTIFDEVVDPNSGAVITIPRQFGTDSGILRLFQTKNDAFTDRPMVNNQPYYFGLTAYSYNPDPEATPKQLESNPVIIEVRPETPKPGVRPQTTAGERLTVLHTAGAGTGSCLVEVYDPLQTTGHNYKVDFSSLGKITIDYHGTPVEFDNYGWNLTDVTTNKQLISKASDYDGLNTGYYTIDGFKIGLTGGGYPVPDKEFLGHEYVGGPNPYVPNAGPPEQFMIAPYSFSGSLYNPWEIQRVIEVRFNRSYATNGYFYARGATPNYGYKSFSPSPIEVWDVTDKSNPKRISYCAAEQNNAANQNFVWDPQANESGGRELLWVLDEPYTGSPTAKYTDAAWSILDNGPEMPLLFYLRCTRSADAEQDPTKFPWQDGDVWRWTCNIPFNTSDVFTFTAPPPPTMEVKDQQNDVAAISVFPNPYYGANQQELNKYQRFVTFNHLPQVARFRVYSVDGTLVRSFEKNDGSQIINWDLQNDNGLPVASGMYIIHIDMPDLGVEKILKLGVVMEAQYLDRI